VAFFQHHKGRWRVGALGEFSTGPAIPEFEELYEELARQTSYLGQFEVSARIDRFVTDEALALFVCASQALYAVNRHVEFTPYPTSFELAECRVGEGHWPAGRDTFFTPVSACSHKGGEGTAFLRATRG
jgi:peptide/nickel transport system substrate-binding protein